MESRKWTTWEELVVIVIFLLTVKRSVFAVWLQMVGLSKKMGKKVKVAHTRLPRLLAVSLQVTWVINQAVGCHYFPPGLQLPLQPLRGQLPILLLDEQRHNGVNSLPRTVTRQHRDCDLNPGPSTPESSTLTTWLPSHHWWVNEYIYYALRTSQTCSRTWARTWKILWVFFCRFWRMYWMQDSISMPVSELFLKFIHYKHAIISSLQ